MLNYNKIHSDINRANIFITDLARYGKIKYTSLKDRFIKKKLYASEVEMISEYFGRPISYYYDQEDTVSSNYPADESLNTVEEPNGHELSIIEIQQRKIEVLTKKLYASNEKNEKINKKYLRLLEKTLDKSGER